MPNDFAPCDPSSPVSGGIFDLPKLQAKIADLEQLTLDPNFWNDRNRAQEISQNIADMRKSCDLFSGVEKDFNDVAELIELSDADGDTAMVSELVGQLDPIQGRLDQLELKTFLAEEFDESDCFLNIKPGAGGTESCDWASMLLRMYSRFLEKSDFTCEVLDVQEEEQGIKSASLAIKGKYAYGYMKGEKGVHRLVRISPFDANARRHTSFAAVDVMPAMPENVDIEVRDEDLDFDFYRSGGKGGQNVNKVSTAVRITHRPSGIVVSCQIERSQHQNRERAMNMLKAKLYQLQKEESDRRLKGIQGDQKAISFGSQIRSYVFCPYTLVKDLRTGESTGDVQRVMDGDINRFINAYLKWHAAGEKPRNVQEDE
ncbi:MAG TPA: peptide chain release factor 2 [Candidatus Ozemobacteraceae bacterium]|nr:peptide chain release factor 2 [Candidatus Ozemobacteraceae bacterium]